jgi:hypothetical protein
MFVILAVTAIVQRRFSKVNRIAHSPVAVTLNELEEIVSVFVGIILTKKPFAVKFRATIGMSSFHPFEVVKVLNTVALKDTVQNRKS